MTEVKLIPADEQYIEQMMVLEHESFHRDAWTEESMRFEVLSNHTRYFVLLQDSKVVGYAGLSKLMGSNQADVQTIAVAPALRGKGYGRKLMQRLLLEAEAQGATEIFL